MSPTSSRAEARFVSLSLADGAEIHIPPDIETDGAERPEADPGQDGASELVGCGTQRAH